MGRGARALIYGRGAGSCSVRSAICATTEHFVILLQSRTFDVMRLSAARTTPSTASTPMAAPALDIASMAYSTWYRRPSGLNIVVRESYLRAMLAT